MLPFINQENRSKIQSIKEKVDKYYTIVIGCFWVLATLWDLIRFHCYWSDYMLEFYSCFFIIFMVLYSLFPAKVPKLILDQFGIIKITLGRGIIMFVFSLLFLGGKHTFHKLCSIFLFIGGFALIILELIAPTKQTEDKKLTHSSEQNQNQDAEKNEHNDSIPDKIDDNQPEPEVLDKNPDENKLPSLEEKPSDANDNDFQFQ